MEKEQHLIMALRRLTREFTHRYPYIEIRGCRVRIIVFDIIEDSIKYMVKVLPSLMPRDLEPRVWRRCEKKRPPLFGFAYADYEKCVFIYRLKNCEAD